MTRTSARAKKSKQDVIKKKEEAKQADENQTDSDAAGESTDKENDSTNFDVEKITHTRIFKGKRQYLVRWKGYSEDNDTWENESALQSCKEVLDAFKKEHLAEANSDEEDAEEETVEKVKSKGKKGSKIVKNNNKKSGRTSSQNIKNKDSEIESEEEPEEETKEVKGAKEKSKKETEELEADSEKHSKKKAAKGKKRKLTKETESRPIKEKKTKKDESDDESVTDGKDYEVEKILEVHTRKDGSREFLIRWKGYKPSDDTWEPEAHLDCQELIEKFMEKVDKAKEYSRKELRQRTETKRFVPLNTGSRRTTQRNRGLRPCYQETYED